MDHIYLDLEQKPGKSRALWPKASGNLLEPSDDSTPLLVRKMTQSEYDFNRLLHQSQQLNAKISGSRNIPTIYRGLEQLEAFSSKLAAKTGIISSDTK
jgi:hypothetical protein